MNGVRFPAGPVLGLTVLGLTGCGGNLGIQLNWGDVVPEVPAHIFAELLYTNGTTVQADAALTSTSALSLQFNQAPFGMLQVQVQVRRDSASTSELYGYGTSALVDFGRGDNLVAVDLFQPPNGTLEVVGCDGQETCRVNTTTISLSFVPATTTQSVRISNDNALSDDPALTESLITWFLESCDIPSGCQDPLFYQFEDANGFSDQTRSFNITLDTTPPALATTTVDYRPDFGNVLARVSAANQGTTITLRITAEEIIQPAPESFVATCGTSTLTFTRIDVGSASAGYTAVVGPTIQIDGTCTPDLTLTDLAGNTTRVLELPDATINLQVTTPTLTINQNQVSYIRAPAQNIAPENRGGFEIPAGPTYFALGPSDGLSNAAALPGDTFTLSDGRTLSAIRVWADASGETLLSSVIRPSTDGSWPRDQLELNRLDVFQVFVTGVDQAGNESDLIPIENAWYIASTADPEVNLHESSIVGRASLPLENRTLLQDLTRVAGLDGQTEVRRFGYVWQEIEADLFPSARTNHAMAYDQARGRVVLFGGTERPDNDDIRLSDTWEWDGVQWDRLPPVGSGPSRRARHALAYDSARGRVVLFGGQGDFDLFDDLWEWDGTQWIEVFPAEEYPPARRGHALAYDRARGRIVLFGGATDIAVFADTWEWDGTQWIEITTTGGPSARSGHAMAYDPDLGQVVLFGGQNAANVLFSDTWTWNGTQWTEVSLTGTSPLGRRQHALAYDPTQKHIVLFGGTVNLGGSSQPNNTWAFDGVSWTQLTIGTDTDPEARRGHALAYDINGKLIMFGGRNASDIYLEDTWTWDGTQWSQALSLNPGPSARAGHAVTYDETQRRFVMFGGEENAGNLDDTWTFDASWTETTSTGALPPGRSNHTLTSVAGLGVVMFGGEASSLPLSDVWILNAGWSQLPSVGPTLEARFGHALVYDSTRGRGVLFGGSNSTTVFSDTWSFAASQWTDLAPAGSEPSARVDHAMGYDQARDRVVLFGGQETVDSTPRLLSDTWEFDGSTWSRITNAGPRPRKQHAMAYDLSRNRVLLFGGTEDTSGSGSESDLWEWDGTEWTELFPDSGPPGRADHTLTYAPDRNQLLMFGGNGAGGPDESTWTLKSSEPSAQLLVNLPSELTAERVAEMQVRAYCGGRGQATDGSATSGAVLLGWAQGQWQSLASNDISSQDTAQTGLINYRTSSATVTQSFLLQRDYQMAFQCRPLGPQGLAEVALDYMEVRVKYVTP